ncbi:MAG: GNAT family N-acetyltransferase, partial [Bizionia sp.]|nr:GNAT family N-acetyltransferase [Bizionia sp.]
QISIVDIFMLAASRLFKQGEFILRISGRASFLDINSIAIAFNFKRISSINKVVDSIAFRFEGQEIKLGYQMLQARTLTSGCVSLFKEVFGHEISNEFWHWKYPRHNEPHSVAAIKNNQVVAHYGLSDRSAVYNDTIWEASQACDVMVSSNERGSISSSVFYELVKIGERPFYRDNSDVSFIYGFPHGRSYKLGARLKLYTPISRIFEVVFDITANSISIEGDCNSSVEIVDINKGCFEQLAITSEGSKKKKKRWY